MQVLSVNLDDGLMDRLDAVSMKLDVNQIQLLQDAIEEKVRELEEMARVMDYLEDEGLQHPAGNSSLVGLGMPAYLQGMK